MKRKPNWLVRRQLKMLTPEKANARIDEAVLLAEWHKALSDERVIDIIKKAIKV